MALPIRDAVSAGGVVWRPNATGDIEVVVCGRNSDRTWGLPKGTPDAGESLEETALREVREETGLHVRLGDKLGPIEYWFVAHGYRWHKFVHYWLMKPTGGDIAEHDIEFDTVAWMLLAEALSVLSYPGERDILVRTAEHLGVAV